MCGIAGIISKIKEGSPYPRQVLQRFTDAVSHRGPDNGAVIFFDGNLLPSQNGGFTVGLGHRRLSIIDLSESGNQPMSICDGKYTITYNGEIYNYIELRKELEALGFRFKSTCDTEVLVAAYAKWGIKCLDKFNGMWAFIIVDREKKSIFVSRDRIGIKPLYVWENKEHIIFASEIKQFFELPDFKKKANSESLLLYLATGYENTPLTFFEDIKVFPSGSYAEIVMASPSLSIQKFWNIPESDKSLTDEVQVRHLIKESFYASIWRHMRSDVPVGLCLSGGLDSSSILVAMREKNNLSQIFAFSACFDDFKYDERRYMEALLAQNPVHHVTVFPDEKILTKNFDTFLNYHDEPVGSFSIFAQYMLMSAARAAKIPVLLDGQGGDELLSGYWNSYMLLLNSVFRSNKSGLIKRLVSCLAPGGNKRIFLEAFRSFMEFKRRQTFSLFPFNFKDRLAGILGDNELAKWHITAQSLSPEEYRKAEIETIHLPRLLKWEDRNSMAFSIESRIPFLDLEFMKLVLSLPPEMNMRKGWTKYIFRGGMDSVLPKEICWRKDKVGFDTPQKKWMKSGAFYSKLLEWTLEKEHPILDYVDANFAKIRLSLQDEIFEPNSMFRLFCADNWLKLHNLTFNDR